MKCAVHITERAPTTFIKQPLCQTRSLTSTLNHIGASQLLAIVIGPRVSQRTHCNLPHMASIALCSCPHPHGDIEGYMSYPYREGQDGTPQGRRQEFTTIECTAIERLKGICLIPIEEARVDLPKGGGKGVLPPYGCSNTGAHMVRMAIDLILVLPTPPWRD